jgi:hypothetical protein
MERTMSKSKSQALRQIAEAIVKKTLENEVIPESQRRDFATSLVRQWITFDGHATLFIGEQQIYFILDTTSLGQCRVKPDPALQGWVTRMIKKWKINPEKRSEIIQQLNLGQGAEVVNMEGLPLRFSVNPKENFNKIDQWAKKTVLSWGISEYSKLAGDVLAAQLGTSLHKDRIDQLAHGVAKQWQQYQGHASLFLDLEQQLLLTLTENDVACMVTVAEDKLRLEPVLIPLGIDPGLTPQVIAQVNLGQSFTFRDRNAGSSILWHDSKERRFHVMPLDPHPSMPQYPAPPVFCPQCSAVLSIWRPGDRQQKCPLCGVLISILSNEK